MVASRKAANTAFIETNEVSNATGCSSIYGGSAPATPYCRWYACEHRFIQSNTVSNYRSGFGPAWATRSSRTELRKSSGKPSLLESSRDGAT